MIEVLVRKTGACRLASTPELVPPVAVANNAKLGLEYRRKFGRGGTEVGVARARDLSNRRSLSPDTIRRMNNYFTRHTEKQNRDPNDPSPGYVAWLLWGGDEGKEWAEKMLKSIDTDRKADTTPTEIRVRQSGPNRMITGLILSLRTCKLPDGVFWKRGKIIVWPGFDGKQQREVPDPKRYGELCRYLKKWCGENKVAFNSIDKHGVAVLVLTP